MLARKPKGNMLNVETEKGQIPSPSSRRWTLAVHEAGHCVMAYLLGVGIIRGVIRPAENTGNVWCRYAGKRYSALGNDPHGRAVVEADALVALGGAVAQWLYKQGSVRGADMGIDDKVATAILKQIEAEDIVAAKWRAYLRQRALVMLSPQRCQALIARLAGRFVEHERLRGDDIEAFLRQQESYVRPFLIERGTIEDYVGLMGTAIFAKQIEMLPLGTEITACLCSRHHHGWSPATIQSVRPLSHAGAAWQPNREDQACRFSGGLRASKVSAPETARWSTLTRSSSMNSTATSNGTRDLLGRMTKVPLGPRDRSERKLGGAWFQAPNRGWRKTTVRSPSFALISRSCDRPRSFDDARK